MPPTIGFEAWKAVDPHWRQLRADAAPKAAETREAWIAERLASGRVSRATLERAVLGGVLGDDFQITLPSRHTVSVRSIRANLPWYEGMQIPDPLEPDYRDGSLCAVIFAWGIFSQAHGGYRLSFERTHAGLDFTAYEPDALDFSIAPELDRLNFDD